MVEFLKSALVSLAGLVVLRLLVGDVFLLSVYLRGGELLAERVGNPLGTADLLGAAWRLWAFQF